ncbi:hypothetical protein [Anaeromyxobacter dehalogenans]|uniref:Uncharacterized protein n=1 Tax=Anaeromyxobacter dehalogenans (strain 2CP-C) TaxID=290397 RepID=Q2IIT5_ANADE|nr:hypothetical protein [Anaeromyxobacter dehalogenans]ABC81563.1 hypothetical protein Adeh_1790 [Anaeromyxobacter dehalogenans 2CP-C]
MPIDKSKLEEFRALNVAVLDPRTAPAERAACSTRLATEVVPALLADRIALLELLRELQWSGIVADQTGSATVVCPVCSFGELEGGHRDDCKLGAFLR